jgi:hypothetical protein
MHCFLIAIGADYNSAPDALGCGKSSHEMRRCGIAHLAAGFSR